MYPAPKSRQNLRERYYFCLEHVRAYNRNWNFFAGYSEEQIYEQILRDTRWERPSWPAGIPQKMEKRLHDFVQRFTRDGSTADKAPPPRTGPVAKEIQALETLGLSAQAGTSEIKARYRELVKKYHPDLNPDNPQALERFRIVSEAYMILQGQR